MMHFTRWVGLLLAVGCALVWADPPPPMLSVTKSHSGNFTQGQIGTWTITVSVSGAGSVATSGPVSVADDLPAGYTLASSSPMNWVCSGTTTVTCTDSESIASGSSFPALMLNVNVPANSPLSVSNSATASGGGAPGSAKSNTDTVTVSQVPASIVATSGTPQSAPVNTQFGALVATVTDARGSPVPNVTVTFTAPSSGASGTFAGGVNTAVTNTMGQAASPQFTANSTAGPYTVTAAAGTVTGASFSLTNTAVPAFSITKSHAGSFTQGQTGTWTINVSNSGSGPTTGTVTVSDALPAGYTLASFSGTGWTCPPAGTVSVSCTNNTGVGPAVAFPALNLTVNVPANAAATVQNTASVSGGGAVSGATSTPDMVSVTQAAATVTATSGGGQSATVNTAFTNPLVATVKDANGTGVPNAIVTFTVVPNNGAGGSFAGGANTATTNGSGVATSPVFTANGTVGTYTVTASTASATAASFSLTNTAALAPALSIAKSHTGTFTQGQTGSWTINVSNTGTGPTSGAVTVSDTLPAGYTLASFAGANWSCTGTNSASVTCTDSADTEASNGSFPPLSLTANVPANSPPSVQNSATASGGGAANPATSLPDTVTVTQAAATITATSGGGQSATVNTAFTNPLVATVKDANGVGVPNATVTFTVVPNNGAGGSFANGIATATTNSSGVATSQVFTANATAGTYTVTAAVGSVTGASFSLTNTAAATPALSITKSHSGSFTQGQTGTWTINVSNTGAGSTSGTVTVSDTLPSGYTFASNTGTHWSCSGAGAVSCTNADVVTSGAAFAPLGITVNVPAGSPVAIQNSATVSGGGAASATSNTDSVTVNQVPSAIVSTSGSGQSAAVNTAFASPLIATVRDAGGAGVANVTVTLTVVPNNGAGGTFAGNANTAVTDANGRATSAVFTANGTAGSYSVNAAAPGVSSPAVFSLSNTTGAAAQLGFSTQPPSTATAGTPFSVVVQIQDASGNLVSTSNAQVTLTSSPAGLTGAATVAAVNGVATFNGLSLTAAGPYTLTAASAPLTMAISNTITIGAASASQLVFTTQPTNGTAGQALSPNVIVKIEDQYSNVVNSTAQVTLASTPSGVSAQTAAVAGVATFSNLIFNAANTYTLTASSTGVANVTSNSFIISAGSGNNLAFSVQPPANALAGQALSPAVTVQVRDANGNLVTASTASITISSTPAGVSGTLTVAASGGVATFSNLQFMTTGTYTLTAAAASLTNATSTAVVVGPGAAGKLAFTVQPASGTAGQALSPAVAVQVQDSNGNLVTTSTAMVTISSTPSGVGGSLSVAAVNGTATFSGLTFTAANNYTLTASSPSLTSATSASFTISAGSGNKLAITVQPPATGTAAQALSPAIVVQIQDSNGNVVTSSTAAISISSTPAGVGGTLTVNAANGVAAFSNLVFNTIGNYTLTATSTGLSNATSTSVAIGPGAAAKLAFTVQPSSGTAGQALTPAVVVQVQDANSNLVTSSAASVGITSSPAGVSASSVNASGGIATFSNLVFTTAGNYTVTAASSGLTSATSNSFTISPGTGNRLVFAAQPQGNGTAGQLLSPVVVQIKDNNGNLVTSSTAAVTIDSVVTTSDSTTTASAAPPNPGTFATASVGGLTGTLTVNAVGGVATFSNLMFTRTGSYSLAATSTGLATATSAAVAIGPAAPNKLAFTVQPSSGTASQALKPPVVVQIQDSFGNLASSGAAISITSTPAGVGGTATLNAAGGIATFSNLLFTVAGNYNLTAISAGLTTATSNNFTITPGAPGGAVAAGGSNQSTQVNRNFANPLVVIVKDTVGNPIPNVTVTFTAPPTGASGTFNGSTVAAAVTGPANGQPIGQAVSPIFTANSIAGTYTVTAAAGNSTASFVLTNVSSLAIGTSSLNAATQATQYSQQLTATGGTPPYTWSLSAGTLPAGMNLAAAGLLSGTPSASGTFPFTAHVRDSAGGAADQALTLVVAAALAVTCPASAGIVNQPYSSAAAATGGQTPYTWSFTTGAFPPGLSLNALTGAVTGTPISPGTFTVTIVVTDKNGASAPQGCGFTIAPALAITTAVVSDASQSSPYSQTFVAIGGKAPYTWTVSAGTIPPGLALSPNGTLSGTPAQTGLFGFTVAVTDSTAASVQQPYTMNVFTGIVIGECPQPSAEVNLLYNSTLVGQGGVVPYTWSVAGGLPDGLQLNAASGTISGTPKSVGQASPTFTVTDKGNRSVNKACPINVRPAVTISTTALSAASTGIAYSDGVAVTGGVSPYVYSTVAGSLPPGLAIDGSTGKITGRPIAAGSFTFTAQATDNLGAQATKSLSITVTQGLTIPNCPAPLGSVGQPYSSPLVAQGGATPYVWSISSGSLPPGLSLQNANNVTAIAGTPTQPGASAFVVQATDAASANVTRACSIQINSAPLAITAPTLPNGTLGVAYSQTLTANGGAGPYTWSIVGAGAPPGLSLDPASGVLSGVPTAVGSYTFTVQAADQSSNVAQVTLSITILAGTAPNVSISGLSDPIPPAAQPTFNVQLAGSYPAPIDGTVALTVVPDPTIGVDDPSIQFATGGRTLKFTVAANSTTPVFTAPVVALQTGTVASTIQLNVTLSSGGVDITPAGANMNVRVFPQAPKIVSMTATQNSSGVQVQIVGYSTTREVTQGTFQFSVAGGGAPLSATVQLTDAARSWFSNQQSTAFGGQFTLTQPFTLQGSVGTLTSVTVTLTNGQGTSAPVTVNF